MAVGYLELLWHFTAKFAPQGDIGRFSDKRIEGALDWTGRGGHLISALVHSKWLDPHLEWRLLVHDWHDHADDSVRKRLNRGRLQFLTLPAKVTGQSSVTDRKVSATQPDNGSLPLPLPLPLPEPQPHPQPPPSPAPAVAPVKVNGHAEYPAILAEIRKHDAAADDAFARRLMMTVVQFCLSSPKYPQALVEELTDENVARCVAESYRTGPPGHRTGLLLNRVPNIVLTWSLED